MVCALSRSLGEEFGMEAGGSFANLSDLCTPWSVVFGGGKPSQLSAREGDFPFLPN